MDSDTETLILLDIYEKLLPEAQANILRMRFDDDLSLSEIGELCGFSRQAARDALVKGEQKLHFFEDALGLAEKEIRLKEIIKQMRKDGADEKHIAMLTEFAEEQ